MNLDFIPESTRLAGLGTLMQGAGKVVRWLPIPQPTLLVGAGSSARLGRAIAGFGHRKLLIVTDAVIVKLGLLKGLTDALTAGGAAYAVFDEITPDAPIPLVERAIDAFREHDCDALVAVGGGSSMDAAKSVALAVANPSKSLRQLAGYYKGLRTPLPLYAVPTTAGTGSEVTVAAVVADPERESKIVIVDTRLVPRMAALDPELMAGLPPAITAATGIDALTHAVESYVSKWATEHTDALALAAISLIFANLPRAFEHGADLDARENMSLASTWAGMAFTRANVGYVHAIAHQFGGKYHTPHGLANAIVLPPVLRYSSPAITARLARLAVRIGAGEESERDDVLAQKFLAALDRLIDRLQIPRHLAALREEDIPALARAACREAETGYPVPRYLTERACANLIRGLLPPPAVEAVRAPRRATRTAGTTETTGTTRTTKTNGTTGPTRTTGTARASRADSATGATKAAKVARQPRAKASAAVPLSSAASGAATRPIRDGVAAVAARGRAAVTAVTAAARRVRDATTPSPARKAATARTPATRARRSAAR